MNMRAAIIAAPKTVRIVEAPRPEPKPGQIVVRMLGCGLCASNLPLWEGRRWFEYPQPPGAPGHEGWGVVDEIGDGVSNVRRGQLVATLSTNSYAEYDVADIASVLPLPSSFASLPVALEPLGCVMNIYSRSAIQPQETVAIVGAGFIGLALSRIISKKAKRVFVLSKRKRLSEFLTGTRTTGFDLSDSLKAIEEIRGSTRGRGCDCVIETGGYQQTLDIASELTRERGRLVIAGYHQDGLRQVNMQAWNWKGLDVINAHERETRAYIEGMNAALRTIGSGQIDPWSLFTHKFDLDRLGEAFQLMANRPADFVKAWIQL
ncbi:MAG TPA: alcohol dehydrogenase catalytic domain-containing protein [Blastocatellia bacterium]|nr:alcohol dehydrogenase catalytic domain-containing protein [Blastocatellia bacterium]